MTECSEIAWSMWQARGSSKSGNGLNVTMPIRSFDEALSVARHYMPGETQTILSNVAENLFERAKRAGTVRLKK